MCTCAVWPEFVNEVANIRNNFQPRHFPIIGQKNRKNGKENVKMKKES